MNAETWVIWEPENIIKGSYSIDSICKNKDGLNINLGNMHAKTEKLSLYFYAGVYCYRETYEAYMDRRMSTAYERQVADFFCNTNFYKIINLEYIPNGYLNNQGH